MWFRRAVDRTEEQQNVGEDKVTMTTSIDETLGSLPPSLLVLSALAIGSSTTVAGSFLYRRYFRRIPNGDWVTPDVLARKRWVKGYVTSVGDNDNFRLYHTPGLGWRWPIKFRRVPTRRERLRDNTIHVRLAGVDGPEGAHFGRPGQPYADEALAWLKSQVHGKTVYCKLIRKDQYGRIVALAHVPRPFVPAAFSKGKLVSLEMLRAGWAVTYEQAGAEYGDLGKDAFKAVQAEAEKARRGMWKNGVGAESPAEYKRRYAGEGAADVDSLSGGTKEAADERLW